MRVGRRQPPRQCGPGCSRCFGPSTYLQVSKNDHLQDVDNPAGHDQRIGVMAYREPGLQPCVYVHLDGIHIYPRRDQILDDSVHLTALEAFDLATALMDTVRTLTGEPKGNRAMVRVMVPPEAAGDFALKQEGTASQLL